MIKQYVLSEDEFNEIKAAIIYINYHTCKAEPSYTISEIQKNNDRIRKIFGLIEDDDE